MNRFKEWKNKPITWGSYLKLCVGCGIISTIYTIWAYWKIGVLEFMGLDEMKNKFNNAKEKVGTKYFDREE